MARPIAVTALPVSPSADQRRRIRMYIVTMSIRVICIIGCVLVTGWWQIACLLGAVVLPYIAVVVANVSRGPAVDEPEAPGPLEIPRSWLE
jgi:hypothetical protein